MALYMPATYGTHSSKFSVDLNISNTTIHRTQLFTLSKSLIQESAHIFDIKMSFVVTAELLAAIVFGILQLTVGLGSLWQQRHLGRIPVCPNCVIAKSR